MEENFYILKSFVLVLHTTNYSASERMADLDLYSHKTMFSTVKSLTAQCYFCPFFVVKMIHTAEGAIVVSRAILML